MLSLFQNHCRPLSDEVRALHLSMARQINSCKKQGKIRSKSPRRVLITSLLGYASATSLHGISYLNHPLLSRAGRIFWTIVCVTGFILTGLYVLRAYQEWKENPVFTHIQSTGRDSFRGFFGQTTRC